MTRTTLTRPALPRPYALALGLSVLASLLLVWLSLGVGLIGRDGDPANRLYALVLAVGVAGALLARLRAGGMVWALLGMAAMQAGIGGYAIGRGLGEPWSGPLELLLLNGLFVGLFLSAALLFRHAQAAGDAR